MMKTRLNQFGYSLVELLVTLGILGVLAALLFPVIATSRKRAQETTCIANLQQISHAFSMYTADYDGAYPLAITGVFENRVLTGEYVIWSDLLHPYLQSQGVPVCPLMEWPPTMLDTPKFRNSLGGYALNSLLNRQINNQTQISFDGRKDNVVSYPALTVTVFDARTNIYAARVPDTFQSLDEITAYAGYFVERSDPTRVNAFLDQPRGATRHHGGANYAFADGHVKWLQPTELSTELHNDGEHAGFGL